MMGARFALPALQPALVHADFSIHSQDDRNQSLIPRHESRTQLGRKCLSRALITPNCLTTMNIREEAQSSIQHGVGRPMLARLGTPRF
jgi:hypothetical protein